MGQSGTSGLCIGTQCCKIGSSRCSDILAHHQRNTEIDRKYTGRTEQDGNSHDGSRTLYDTGDDRTYQKECDDGKMALRIKRTEEIDDRRIVFQIEVLSCPTQEDKGEEEKSNAKEEIAEIAFLLAID